MARILGSDTVLPDLPPQPKLHQFPTKKLTRDTLPAFNAMGQNIVANNVRPSPTIVNQPSMNLSHLSRFRAEDMIPNMSVHVCMKTLVATHEAKQITLLFLAQPILAQCSTLHL